MTMAKEIQPTPSVNKEKEKEAALKQIRQYIKLLTETLVAQENRSTVQCIAKEDVDAVIEHVSCATFILDGKGSEFYEKTSEMKGPISIKGN